ncbi:MAG TPA: long-chain fatty acid--CoA ligase [Candidatus Acidoferrum sp.]|jgi:fatty-acyl-CoA synthase|nr:long-chain fatty acid--CoA ligase [Candidatus Acidoferrum sp.]
MRGTMMDYPLTLPAMLERAGKLFGRVEIVSRRPDRSIVRTNYGDFYRRARRLASALTKLGLRPGDRVASMMWNHSGHLEAFFGVPSAGGILHTLNLRLHPHEIAAIAKHAGDRFLLLDDVLLPNYEKFCEGVSFERVIVVPYCGGTVPEGFLNYEELLAQASDDFTYPKIDENDGAAMCFTSGTTGFSKGVIYSHRALVLHSFAEAMADSFAVSHDDTVLPVAPMFHANAWGIPYTCVMTGSRLILPGPNVDAESILDLLEQEHVTCACGVPTVWLSVLYALEKNAGRWKFSSPVRILCGGTAPPVRLMRALDKHNLHILHLWGMTETTPLATLGKLKRHMRDWPEDSQYEVRGKQGWPAPFVDLRVMRPEGPEGKSVEAPWDGETPGELEIRGPWIAASYYNAPDQAHRWTEDGWFKTGDVATIDSEGIVKIVDRAKDLVKSGGEWISSVDLENTLMGHPAVKEAAVVGIPHPKWQERPLAAIVLNDGAKVTPEELREFLGKSFAKWQLPDAFVFLDAIPRTSVGKFKKTALREQFANWTWEE